MTLFTRVASATLAGLCVLGMAGAAYAHHTPRQPFSETETAGLLRSASSAGIQIFIDNAPETRRACRKGLYGAANYDNQLLLCTKNHGDDMVEFADTVRHELIHSAQFCKARKHGATSALLYPAKAQENLRIARDILHMPMQNYKPSKYFAEAEARVLAHNLEEAEVAALLKEHCG